MRHALVVGCAEEARRDTAETVLSSLTSPAARIEVLRTSRSIFVKRFTRKFG
jgi:hypothetical protein